jgi:vacuolar protein sorting-associated protein 16
LIDDDARLIAKQDEIEKKLISVQLKGLSLVNTLEYILPYNERDADQLRKEFNITDKRYYWIKIQAYAKKQYWTQLVELGKKSTSPIGYEVMVFSN